MNGGVDPRVAPAHQNQAVVPFQIGPEGESAQLSQEGVTVFDSQSIVDPAIQVFN
jgi:hypothetical protein